MGWLSLLPQLFNTNVIWVLQWGCPRERGMQLNLRGVSTVMEHITPEDCFQVPPPSPTSPPLSQVCSTDDIISEANIQSVWYGLTLLVPRLPTRLLWELGKISQVILRHHDVLYTGFKVNDAMEWSSWFTLLTECELKDKRLRRLTIQEDTQS